MTPIKALHNIAIILSTVALLLVGSLASAEDPAPSGTLTMKETEVGLLLGGDWGKGTLTFDGKEYPFKMAGAKVGGIGITVAEVSGNVYQLTKAEDFYGTYFKAEAGITGVKGKEGSWVKNPQGVPLHLTSESQGLALSVGVEGLQISK